MVDIDDIIVDSFCFLPLQERRICEEQRKKASMFIGLADGAFYRHQKYIFWKYVMCKLYYL